VSRKDRNDTGREAGGQEGAAENHPRAKVRKRLTSLVDFVSLKKTGCIHHSDRGVSGGLTVTGNVDSPMTVRSGIDLYILKYEEVHLSNYETYDDVIERLPHFIEEVDNKNRLHSTLGYYRRRNTR
jgi:hypothetical protein